MLFKIDNDMIVDMLYLDNVKSDLTSQANAVTSV